ncbi:MAG: hypothetical protein EHM20_04480 [Alphaproteobacteria bacterium]|nr:MAG: hypothetical protein EHM20_04480 [Alphaproteobacteria bacterium]
MKSLILLATIIFSQITLASGNHYHPKQILKCTSECTEVEVKAILPTALDTLAKAKEVRESWKQVPLEKIEKRQFKKGPEWVAIFFDKSQKEVARQRLYVFITLDGWLNGANNSGN